MALRLKIISNIFKALPNFAIYFTVLYTNHVIGTYIDEFFKQIIQCTSSLMVHQVLKAALPTGLLTVRRTELVRLIERSI